jgi:hypothetical protein
MFSRRTLILASFAVAVAWTAAVVWWETPMTTSGMVIVMITGAIAGNLWYRGMCIVDEVISAPHGIEPEPK